MGPQLSQKAWSLLPGISAYGGFPDSSVDKESACYAGDVLITVLAGQNKP